MSLPAVSSSGLRSSRRSVSPVRPPRVRTRSASLSKKTPPKRKTVATAPPSLLTRYAAQLKAHPLLLGAPQQAFILALANAAKQVAVHTWGGEIDQNIELPFSLDFIAVRNAAFLGGCCMAPPLYCWYQVLNRHVSSNLYKTAIDQLIMGWVFNTYAQFILAKLNGDTFVFSQAMVRLVLLR